MIAILLWLACVPAPNWPTPVLEWDQVRLEDVDGHRVYYRDPADALSTWQLAADLPTWWYYDEAGNPTSKHRWGFYTDAVYPIQRGTDHEAEQVEWMVRAYNSWGESADSDNTVTVCMPRIWRPGEVYE